jgi:hypothetical protein
MSDFVEFERIVEILDNADLIVIHMGDDDRVLPTSAGLVEDIDSPDTRYELGMPSAYCDIRIYPGTRLTLQGGNLVGEFSGIHGVIMTYTKNHN